MSCAVNGSDKAAELPNVHADAGRVPIIDVHSQNISSLWPALTLGIAQSSFIGLDLELSGLGNRKNLMSKCVEERYKAIAETAKSRSVISLGISCFKSIKDESSDLTCYQVQTYNILTLCSEDFIIEPGSVKFLIDHGFDFNRQYALGLPYESGTLKGADCYSQPSLRLLFRHLIDSKVAIVLHNGFVDLLFLYQNFYLDLPTKLSSFVADLEDMFPSFIYDTKYLAEFFVRMKASYLEFVYRTCIKLNKENNRVRLYFLQLSNSSDLFLCSLNSGEMKTTNTICTQYADHGWCADGKACKNSHDVHVIVNTFKKSKENKKKRRKRQKQEEKKRLRLNTESDRHSASDVDIEQKMQLSMTSGEEKNIVGMQQSGCHRAGVDAYMTGMCFAYLIEQLDIDLKSNGMYGNRLYLCGKDIPLQITRGNFGKTSRAHAEMAELLKHSKNA